MSDSPATPALETLVPELFALLEAASVAYKLVGDLAVVHHGYARTTEDHATANGSSQWKGFPVPNP